MAFLVHAGSASHEQLFDIVRSLLPVLQKTFSHICMFLKLVCILQSRRTHRYHQNNCQSLLEVAISGVLLGSMKIELFTVSAGARIGETDLSGVSGVSVAPWEGVRRLRMFRPFSSSHSSSV